MDRRHRGAGDLFRGRQKAELPFSLLDGGGEEIGGRARKLVGDSGVELLQGVALDGKKSIAIGAERDDRR